MPGQIMLWAMHGCSCDCLPRLHAMAVSRPYAEAGDLQAPPGVVAHAGAALARPGTPAHGSRRAAGKGLPGGGADADTTLTVRTAGSAASAHSWRIEAAGTGGSPPRGSDAAAAAEVARLREELASAHQLHADLELSSGETMQVLQQQVGFESAIMMRGQARVTCVAIWCEGHSLGRVHECSSHADISNWHGMM